MWYDVYLNVHRRENDTCHRTTHLH